jgi:hypothetical protein
MGRNKLTKFLVISPENARNKYFPALLWTVSENKEAPVRVKFGNGKTLKPIFIGKTLSFSIAFSYARLKHI